MDTEKTHIYVTNQKKVAENLPGHLLFRFPAGPGNDVSLRIPGFAGSLDFAGCGSSLGHVLVRNLGRVRLAGLARLAFTFLVLAAAATGRSTLDFILGSGFSAFSEINQLDDGHVGGVTHTETGAHDAGVSTRTIGDLRRDHAEKLTDCLFLFEVAEYDTT